uniref:DUF4268 domain-containing protein n=1 Tax=Panagrellus redivivus TaxID=6233 RepID=A0A7E4V893_PANRE
MNDQTPDIMYYIEHCWTTVYRTVEEGSIKQLLTEVVRKLYILRDSVWATKKTEFNSLIVRVIKRADEELIKCDGIKFEKLIQRMPYESLDTLPLRELVGEAYLRFEGLFGCYWNDETTTYKTNLVNFLKTLDEMIVKYNRIE